MIFVNADTKEVIRITIHVELPPKFPVKAAEAMVDYKPITIAGKTSLCRSIPKSV